MPHPHTEKKNPASKQTGVGHGGLDDRIPAGVGKRRTTNKQDENDERPHPIPIITRATSSHITHPHYINRPAQRQEHNETHDETTTDAG